MTALQSFSRAYLAFWNHPIEDLTRRSFLVAAAVIVYILVGPAGTTASILMGIVIVSCALILIYSLAAGAVSPAGAWTPVDWVAGLYGPLLLAAAWQLLAIAMVRSHDTASWAGLYNTAAILGFVMLIQVGMRLNADGALDRLCAVLLAVGAFAAVVSFALYAPKLISGQAFAPDRLDPIVLDPIGRAGHSIVGAAGLAAAVAAGVVLWMSAQRLRLLVGLGMVAAAGAVLLTQSRGAVLALAMAALFLGVAVRLPSPRQRLWLLAGLCAAGVLLPLVLAIGEETVRHLFCIGNKDLCRPSGRPQIWAETLRQIAQAPFFGIGPSGRVNVPMGRLPADWGHHPHNSVLGASLYFGLPMTALMIGLAVVAGIRSARIERREAALFVQSLFVFAAFATATDHSNLMGDINTPWLFFWLPIALSFALSDPRTARGERLDPARASAYSAGGQPPRQE